MAELSSGIIDVSYHDEYTRTKGKNNICIKKTGTHID
jgi:hypothetical protein